MSLINQVLKDLEQRRVMDTAQGDVLLKDVRFVADRAVAKSRWKKPAIISAVLIAALIIVWYYWPKSSAAGASSAAQVSPADVATPPVTASQETPPLVTAKADSVVSAAPTVVPAEQSTAETKPVISNSAAAVAVTPAKRVKAAAPAVSEAEESIAMQESTGSMTKQALPMSHTQQAAVQYETAYALIAEHRLREAEQILRDGLQQQPQQVQLRELLVGLYIKSGRWIEATAELEQAIRATPQHQPFVKLYARALMQTRQDAQAIALLKQRAPAVAADPEHHALLAALYQRQNDHAAAAAAYKEVVKVQPHAGVWWVGLGISLERLGHLQEAQAAFMQARATGGLAGDVARYADNRVQALQVLRLTSE